MNRLTNESLWLRHLTPSDHYAEPPRITFEGFCKALDELRGDGQIKPNGDAPQTGSDLIQLAYSNGYRRAEKDLAPEIGKLSDEVERLNFLLTEARKGMWTERDMWKAFKAGGEVLPYKAPYFDEWFEQYQKEHGNGTV